MNNKRYIFVIGAHRSGTSLLASFIASLGAQVGLEQFVSNEENAHGFWENKYVVELNDEILRHTNLSWDILHLPHSVDFTGESFQPFRQKAKQILSSQFPDASVILIKDPRLCFLMPFWLKVLQDLGCKDVKAIILYREPTEMVASQQSRAFKDPEFYNLGFRREQVLLHWYTSMRSAIEINSLLPTFYIKHQTLLAKCVPVLNAMAQFIGFEYEDGVIEKLIDEVVDEELYRNRLEYADSSIPYGFVEELAQVLRQAVEGVDGLYKVRCNVQRNHRSEFANSALDELQFLYGQSYKNQLTLRHHLLLRMQDVDRLDSEVAVLKEDVAARKKEVTELEKIVSYQENHIQLLEHSLAVRSAKRLRTLLAIFGFSKSTK